jgi:ribonuclease HI
MAKKKWYAVKRGRIPGVYTEWPEAEVQVKGFAGARFKGFPSEEEAQLWVEGKLVEKKSPAGKSRTVRSNSENAAPREGSEDYIVIYTDGGAINNPGPGGYGVVLAYGKKCEKRLANTTIELSGGFRLTTNNRMELMACIIALRELKETDTPVTLFSDSSYVVNGLRKGWAKKWKKNGWVKADKKQVKNQDLWAELLQLSENLKVTFHWVKGHAGNPMNERCDKLAVQSARGSELRVDVGYEQG